MSDVPDAEIHQIVQRVLNQFMGLSPAAPPTPPVEAKTEPAAKPAPPPAGKQTIAIGADHGGYDLKEILKPEIAALGYAVIDVGTSNKKDPVDYPDYAHEVAKLVASGKAWRGIMIDGAGIGSCMAANKVPGVRAGLAYDVSSAINSREHNDANLLTLGAGLIGVNLARQIVKTWLATPFGGGRHAGRVDKITAVEKQYLK